MQAWCTECATAKALGSGDGDHRIGFGTSAQALHSLTTATRQSLSDFTRRRDPASTIMGVAMLSGWLRTFAVHENAGLVSGAVRHQQIAAVIGSGEYPHLADLFASPDTGAATEPLDIDAVFRTGVEALLFGIAPNV